MVVGVLPYPSMMTRLEKLASVVTSIVTSLGVVCAAVLFIWRTSAFMTEMEFRVSALQNAVVQIQQVDIDARATLKKETDDRLGAMEQRILGLEAANTATQTSINSSASGVAALQAHMTNVQSSIDELKTDVGNIAHKLDAIGGKR